MDILGDTNRLVKSIITRTGFLFAAEGGGQLVHGVLLHMNPGNQLCIRILTPADYPGGRAFQIGDLNIIMFLYTQLVELHRRQKLHKLAVSRHLFGKYRMKVNVRSQKLLIDAAAKENCDGNIKF